MRKIYVHASIIIALSISLIILCCAMTEVKDTEESVIEEGSKYSFPAIIIVEKDTEEEDIAEDREEDPLIEEVQSEEHEYVPNNEDVEALARTLYGECYVVPSTMRRAAVAWCVLNRLDDGSYGDTVLEIVSAPSQFVGYSPSHPLVGELVELATDVLIRWNKEHSGIEDVGRVLPASYKYFYGDGSENHFREEFSSTVSWDWSLPDIYSEIQ